MHVAIGYYFDSCLGIGKTGSGLPPKTGFDFFVIQVPKAPFGLAWYQGDVETNAEGNAFQHFKGRFNIETFAFAQGPAPAQNTFPDPPFPDATVNPTTDPVQMYHLGMWFNSFKDAQKCWLPRDADSIQWRA
jgi:hypothetical protein